MFHFGLTSDRLKVRNRDSWIERLFLKKKQFLFSFLSQSFVSSSRPFDSLATEGILKEALNSLQFLMAFLTQSNEIGDFVSYE